jgi:hypothetical protein
MRKPSGVRFMTIGFPSGAVPAGGLDLPRFRSLSLSAGFEDEAGHGTVYAVTLEAQFERDNDVFTSLVQDVVTVTSEADDAEAAARAFQFRLGQWQRLLQRDRRSGLTDEEQRGLYGELCVLQDQVLPLLLPLEAVQAWTGPEGTAKDFQFPGGVALEVKTSLARPPHEIRIANERQLDDTGLEALFLLFRLLEVHRGSGETLPHRVERLRKALSPAPAARALLDERLEDYGYFDVHAVQYREAGYVPRSAHLYGVRDGFPRITGASLPAGVGGVSYVVSAAACAPFELPLHQLPAALEGESR